MSVFEVIRSRWQLPLDTAVYDLTLAAYQRSKFRGRVERDCLPQPQTQFVIDEDDGVKKSEEKRKVEEEKKRRREKAQNRVALMFGESSGLGNAYYDALMIYSDGREMGVQLSLRSHATLLGQSIPCLSPMFNMLSDMTIEHLYRRLKAFKSCWQTFHKKHQREYAQQFLRFLSESDQTGPRVFVRLLHIALSIHVSWESIKVNAEMLFHGVE